VRRLARSKDIVGNVMSRTGRTAPADEPLRAAIALMAENDIGSVVVMRNRSPVGIITERDIMKALDRKSGQALDGLCADLASKPLITVSPDLEVWDAFTIMLRNKIRRLPVTRDGRLAGILTERDLFNWVVGVIYEPNVPDDIKKLIKQNP